jgi:zinc and cadmium transporter
MYLLYNFFLFLVSFLGGCIPLWGKGINEQKSQYLLAFSGAFLLSITFLHLLPETFEELHHEAGILVLGGFFLQMLIQRFTHGFEHGHVHVHPHATHVPINAILIGMAVHAFMEGLPLGFQYRETATEPSLYLAVAAHKLPEAMLISGVVASMKGRKTALTLLFVFSLITPLSSVLASVMGRSFYMVSQWVIWIIPIVAGAFIHIATTIFFESGTRQHMMTPAKVLAILLGVGISLLTLLFE